MAHLIDAWIASAAALFAAVTLLWLVSLALRDASIVDVFWGLGFVLVAWIGHLVGDGETVLREKVLLACVTLWGVRLAAYIFWRSRGEPEDYRYRAMRERQGESFKWTSYPVVFLLQGGLVLLIAQPLLVVAARPQENAWSWTDTLGVVLFAIGFFFEAVGDWQMARFKADPENAGQVMRSGLWALTRHPNYFGDTVLWWGYFAFALGAPGGIFTLPCPILMTFLILKISGVSLLERTIEERRPKYRDYAESTNAFFPWFPRRQD